MLKLLVYVVVMGLVSPGVHAGFYSTPTHAADDAFLENHNMNPCEDFYTFVCESQYKNPDGTLSSFKSLVSEAQDTVVAKIKNILNHDYPQNVFPFTIAQRFYQSCINTEKINSEGMKPIQLVLKELKGWPLINEHAEYELVERWQDIHLFYSKISVFPFFEIIVNNDALKETNTILVRQPKTIIKELQLQQSKVFYKYVEYIKTVGMSVAKVSKSAVLEQEVSTGAKQIAAFELDLLKIMDLTDGIGLYRSMRLKKFQNITDKVSKDNNTLSWIKMINGMHPVKSSKLVGIDDSIDVSTPSYFPRLVQLLHRTPLRTIINYIHWRFVHQFLPHTSSEMRNLFFEMKSFFQEPVKNLARWRFCGFEPAFDPVIAHAFAYKYLPSNLEKSAQGVLDDIKTVTMQQIKKSSWLNEEEKETAEKKILNMEFVLGIPEAIKNLSTLDGYYQKLSISDDYFNNVLNLRKFHRTKEFESMAKSRFKSSANVNFMKITTISSLGSAYEFFDNRVHVKAENLMKPLFDSEYPDSKKYGILGFIIAYEIMHAFNDADSIGIPEPRKHLYSEETKLKLWERLECFINQYDHYYIPDPFNWEKHIYVNGERSAMENVADSTAVKIALEAYRQRTRHQGSSESREDDKEFFASFANLLCRPELEEFYLSRFNLALRTLPRFRVIGSLSNANEFAKSFSCPDEAQMNPKTRCDFWN